MVWLTPMGTLWIYSVETGSYRRLGPGVQAQWLDGRRLLHARQGGVFVTDTVTGDAREVVTIPGETLSWPRAAPDGRSIYFLRGSQSGDIWLVQFDGSDAAAVKTP